MAGLGSCFCCNSWDDIERYVAASKPWAGILGIVNTAPCDTHYLKRVTIRIYTWSEDDNNGSITHGSFTDVLTETWEQYTNVPSQTLSRIGQTPIGYNNNWINTVWDQHGEITRGSFDNTHDAYSQSVSSSDGLHSSDIEVKITLTDEYPLADHKTDWDALFGELTFRHIMELKSANAAYRYSLYGYLAGGSIGHVDYYNAIPPVYSGCGSSDASVWSDAQTLVGILGYGQAGYATSVPLLPDGEPTRYAWGCLMIEPVTPNTTYCREYHALTGCPHTIGATQYTSIPSGSATSIRMGDEGETGTTFSESLRAIDGGHPCHA